MSDLSALTPGTWTVDAGHSTVGFSVRHLMVAKVRGQFTAFSGSITVADEPLQSKVEATVDAGSIDTRDASRDGHLKSADFFEIETYPTMTFTSTSVTPDGDDYKVVGDLTLKGVTKSVELELEFNGVHPDPWGGTRAGFSAETEISRKQFGVDFEVPMDGPGVVVGDKVKVYLEVEAVLQTD